MVSPQGIVTRFGLVASDMEWYTEMGAQYVLLFPDAFRLSVFQRLGYSPTVERVLRELDLPGMYGVNAQRFGVVQLLPDSCCGEDAVDILQVEPVEWLQMIDFPYHVFQQGELADVHMTFGPVCMARLPQCVVEDDIVIGGDLAVFSDDSAVVQGVREVLIHEFEVDLPDDLSLEKLLTRAVDRYHLADVLTHVHDVDPVWYDHVVRNHLRGGVEVGLEDKGFCYLRLFIPALRYRMAGLLGPNPQGGHLLLQYLLAYRYGYAVTTGYSVVPRSGNHYGLERASVASVESVVHQLLRVVERHGEVGGYGCGYLALVGAAGIRCEACRTKQVLACVSVGTSRQSQDGFIPGDEGGYSIFSSVCKSECDVVGWREDIAVSSDLHDPSYKVRVNHTGDFGLRLESNGSISLQVVYGLMLLPSGVELEFTNRVKYTTQRRTAVLVSGGLDCRVVKAPDGAVALVRSCGGSAWIQYLHKLAGVDPTDTFSRFWTRVGSPFCVFGLIDSGGTVDSPPSINMFDLGWTVGESHEYVDGVSSMTGSGKFRCHGTTWGGNVKLLSVGMGSLVVGPVTVGTSGSVTFSPRAIYSGLVFDTGGFWRVDAGTDAFALDDGGPSGDEFDPEF